MSNPFDQFDGKPDIAGMVTEAAQRYGVPPELALRVARQESGLRTNAVSPKGARGPMQLMPATARDLGVDPDDPAQNIDGGVRYLAQQRKRFGDDRLALAAYNAGPGAVARAGGIPNYRETQNYVQAIAGPGGGNPFDQFDAGPAPAPDRGPDASTRSGAVQAYVGGFPDAAPAAAPQAKPAAPPPKVSQGLGFMEGAAEGFGHVGDWVKGGLDNLGVDTSGIRTVSDRMKAAEAKARGADPRFADAQPGRLGRFAGNVVGTSWLPGGPLAQGAASGAMLSDATDLKGVLTDAVIGGAAGKFVDKGLKVAGEGAQALLGKAPKIMSLPELKAAKQAAYDAVDNSGFAFPKAKVSALVNDLAKSVSSSALSKSAKEDAQSVIRYARTLANGDLPLSQLEKLRGDIYEAMVKKGGDTGRLGTQFRAKIDALMDTASSDVVRNARELNSRFKKAEFVTRMSKSADRAAERTYGGDYGRKVKDRLNPLIDEAMPQKNLRGATRDELAAIEKVVRGTKVQNLASTVGGMLDPRRMGGKILAGITTTGGGAGAPLSGGLSLLVPAAQMAAGFGLTGTASKIARQNVDDLLRLIAVGGSKQALKKAPTTASKTAQKAVAAARPVAGLIGGTAAHQARGGR